jgi:2-polyprenyl-3-methyl-5-hydroxy-6-metoxy-1,4-benzoquinol methylase
MMEQNEFWDQRSDKYDLNIRGENFFGPTIEKTRTLLNESDLVLDVGCATGEIGLEIANTVQHVHGIDTSKVMIDKAKCKAEERKINNVEFDCLDVNAQSIKRESYNKIFAFNVLHLVDNPIQAINRMSELLCENGHVVSETPCLGERGWLFRALIAVFVKVGMAPPIMGLSYRKMKQMFLENKFEIVQEEIFDDKDKVVWIVAKKA